MEASAIPLPHSLAADQSRLSVARSQSAASTPRFPNGACNFHHPGDGAQPCGCRRFWLNDVLSNNAGGDTDSGSLMSTGAWCFCGHHACFHAVDETAHTFRDTESMQDTNNYVLQSRTDAYGTFGNATSDYSRKSTTSAGRRLPVQALRLKTQSNTVSAMTGRQRLARATVSSMQTRPPYPSSYTFGDLPNKTHTTNRLYSSFGGVPSKASTPLEATWCTPIEGTLAQERWNPPAQSTWDEAHISTSIHPVTPQFRDASESKEARQSSPARYRGMPASQRNSQASLRQSMSYRRDNFAMSPTEVASTPSYTGTPMNTMAPARSPIFAIRHTALDYNNPSTNSQSSFSPHAATEAPHVSDNERSNHQNATIDYVLSQIATLRSMFPADPNLNASLAGLRHRLDALECVTYSRGPDDELQDAVDLFEGRLIDTEEKVEELERFRANHTGKSVSPSLKDASFQEASSFLAYNGLDPSSRLSPLVNLSHESANKRIEEFEQRLQILESAAPPTLMVPWEIEVVLLPWGRGLQGIWFAPDDDIERPVSSSKVAATHPSRSHHSTSQKAFTPHDFTREESLGRALKDWGGNSNLWLAPRACGPTKGSGGKVYERLKSRGMVRNVNLHYSSAREVQQDIYACFADIFTVLEHTLTVPAAASATYLGLSAPFVPLRKVHKSSRLRFLSAAELTTPSLWTAEFLNSSVFMKAPSAGLRRLFITPASAYFQHTSSRSNNEMTWLDIQRLPRSIQASSDDEMREDDEVDRNSEGNDEESCWETDTRLDTPVSVQSSFAVVESIPESSFKSLPSPASEQGLQDFSSDADDDDLVSDASSMDDIYLATTPTSLYSARQFRRTVSDPLTAQQVNQVVTVQTMTKRHESSSQHAERKFDSISKRQRVSQGLISVDANSARQTRWTLTPRLSHEPPSPASRTPNTFSQGTHRSVRTYAPPVPIKRAATPSAYATPYSNNYPLHGVDQIQAGGDTDMDSDDELGGPSTQYAYARPAFRQRTSDGDWDAVVEEAHHQMQASDQDDEHDAEDRSANSNDDDDEDSHEDEQIFEEWVRKADDDEDEDEDDQDEPMNEDEDEDHVTFQ